MPSTALIEAVAVTAELCGRTFSEPAARVFVSDLSRYPEHQVIGALARCRKEVRGLLTVSDVVARLDDGRPGPEEAWALMPMTEGDSAVWTDEMRAAFGVAGPLIATGDLVAARMAFKETYARLLTEARDAGRLTQWSVTLGHDPGGREAALMLAVDKGRISLAAAQEHCPALAAPEVLRLVAPAVRGAA